MLGRKYVRLDGRYFIRGVHLCMDVARSERSGPTAALIALSRNNGSCACFLLPSPGGTATVRARTYGEAAAAPGPGYALTAGRFEFEAGLADLISRQKGQPAKSGAASCLHRWGTGALPERPAA